MAAWKSLVVAAVLALTLVPAAGAATDSIFTGAGSTVGLSGDGGPATSAQARSDRWARPPSGGALATFGPAPLVALSLGKSTIPGNGRLALVADNANDFTVSGSLVMVTAASRARAARKKKAAPKPVASAKFELAAKSKQTIRLRLSGKARRLLETKRKLRLTATATLRDPAGATRTVTRPLVVRLAKPKRKR